MKLSEILAILGIFVIFFGAVFIADYVRSTGNYNDIPDGMIDEELTFYDMYAEIGIENSGNERFNEFVRIYMGNVIDENTTNLLIIDKSGTVLQTDFVQGSDEVWFEADLKANDTTIFYILPLDNSSLMPEVGEQINYAY